MATQDKHTPGPWVAKFAGDRGVEGRYDIDATNGIFIAETLGGMSGGCGEQAANARLIAAAPEMLAALRQAVRYAKRGEAPPAGDWTVWAAAIAKATGA